MVRQALWFAWLLVWGCGSASDPVSDSARTGAEPHFELGQGELAFAPLSDDEALPYAAGSQGGHHVFVSFRVQHLEPSRMHISVTTEVLGQPELVLTRQGRVNFAPAPDDAGVPAEPSYDFAGWPAQILMAPCYVGEAARIDVTLTDLDQRSACATRTIRIAEPDTSSTIACPPR